MSKAKELLGFEPKYSLEDAVRNIKDWVDAGGLDRDEASERDYGAGVENE